MRPGTLLLETVHGSRLYGLDHENSDHDSFQVIAGLQKPRVATDGYYDVAAFGLDAFLTNVYNGSHQSCEALWSPVAYKHPALAPYFDGIRVTGADAFARYRRTIRTFSYGNVKRRRHAVRLGYNLSGLRKYGRFNPTLSDGERHAVLLLASTYWGQSLYDISINL